MTHALDLPETAAALERYRRRAAEIQVTGGVLLAPAVAVGFAGPEEPWAGDLTGWLVTAGLAVLGLGSYCRSRAARKRDLLGSGVWSAHAAVALTGPWSGEAVVLAAPDGGEPWPMRVFASQWRYAAVRPGPDAVLWWCGDPREGGVLAPPGGGELLWAKPVRMRGSRRRLLRGAAEAGLPDREAPVQPRRPVPSPEAPAPLAAPPAPLPRRRRWGRWRWLLLVSAAVFAVAAPWSAASDRDPQVDLAVLSEEPDGSCVVRWKDPFDGRQRTGAFVCDPDRSPLLADRETAFVVSYGPWKGELYGYPGGERRGSPSQDVMDGATVLSFLGAATGLVGGGVGVVARRRAARRREAARVAPAAPRAPAATAAAPAGVPAGDASGAPAGVPTYGVLAERAVLRAVVQGGARRPEADVREVPWWRVRSLRRAAGAEDALLAAGAVAGFGAGIAIQPVGVTGAPVYAMAVLALGALVRFGYRFWASGVPVARLLARAATAPVPVTRRYVLLHDPYGGLPVLVLFAEHGGPEDRPEGVLSLLSPGTRKRPWLGLPAEPVGTAELRGWLDRAGDGQPAVVAWIDGRAFWPAAPYQEAGEREAAALLARLVPARGGQPAGSV